jgi:hypothetical protein
MRSKLFLWLTALALLAGAQCKKHSSIVPDNPYGLPNVGEPGTMGCLINGKLWIASPAALSPNSAPAFTYGDSVFTAAGQDTGYYYYDINIRVSANGAGFSVGTPIAVSGGNYPVILSCITDSSCLGPYNALGNTVSGTVTITKLDTVSHEFAGTFSATIALSPCDTIQITEGRFDQYYISI